MPKLPCENTHNHMHTPIPTPTPAQNYTHHTHTLSLSLSLSLTHTHTHTHTHTYTHLESRRKWVTAQGLLREKGQLNYQGEREDAHGHLNRTERAYKCVYIFMCVCTFCVDVRDSGSCLWSEAHNLAPALRSMQAVACAQCPDGNTPGVNKCACLPFTDESVS